jgi:DNA polymerase-3 subunit delta'
MLFSKTLGHTVVLFLLQKYLESVNFQGAFIFSGPVGVGKHEIAKTFSKHLTCIGTKDDTCRCDNCRAFPDTPDILFISPDGSSIKVDQIREIENFLSLAPFNSKRRVVLIDAADTMSYAASNALLKIFEEPPEDSLIILVTGEIDKILPTIQSRAEIIEFGGLTGEEFKEVMKGKGYSLEAMEGLIPCVRSFSGNVVANFSVYLSSVTAALSFLKDFCKKGDDDIISMVSDIDSAGTLKEFSEALIIGIGDIYRFRKLGIDHILLGNKWENISSIEKDWTDEGCLISIDKIRQALDSVDNRLNLKLRPRLVVALMSIKSFLKKEKEKNDIKA